MRGPTTDHDEIRRWAESNGAVPAEVHPRKFDGEPATLRFLFGEVPRELLDLQPITWENFFAKFDLMGLSMVYGGNGVYELLQVEARSAYGFDSGVM